jgi:hypothetical protein
MALTGSRATTLARPSPARIGYSRTVTAALFGTFVLAGCGGDGDDVPGDYSGPRVAGLPHVVVEGTPLEMGRAHGRALRAAIRARVAAPIDPALESSLALFGPPMRDLLPPSYAEELRGIAQGADVDVDALFLREVAREVARWHDRAGPLLHAAFASAPGTAPTVAVAFDGVDALGVPLALVERRPAGGVATLVLGAPGSLGGIAGVSARGVVAVSAEDGSLAPERRSLRGPPFAAGLRLALERAGDAESALATVPRLIGHRVLLADAGNRRVQALVAGTGEDPVRSDPEAWVLAAAGQGETRAKNGAAQEARLGAYPRRPGPDDAVALAVAGRATGEDPLVLRFAGGRVEVTRGREGGSVAAPR